MSADQTQVMQLGNEISAGLIEGFAVGPETTDAHDKLKARVRAKIFQSFADLAERWGCSRGTVYNRLRTAGAKVLDFSSPGKRSKKGLHINDVLEIERKWSRRLC
jgi:ABC-type proline/glycine betaine transport system substrate-binding protein